MNKNDIYEYLKKEFPELNKEDLKKVLDGSFKAMAEALRTGDKVEIRGLGSFKVKYRNKKIAKNPKTGEWIEIPPRKTVLFKMGKIMKAKLFSKKV